MNPEPRRLHALSGLVAALGVWAWLALRADFVIDDAFIAFRYARNWSEWGLPIFNPGELPPVEGYSNFLWVLLLRCAHGLGWGLESTARVLGYASAALSLLLVHALLLRRLRVGPGPAAIGTLALAATPGFAVWTSGGLETALFSLLLLATFTLLSAPPGPVERLRGGVAGALAIALALCRVEGFLWVLGLALCTAPTMGSARSRRLTPYLALYLAGFGAFLLWRHDLYGDWLANTVQAKSGGSWGTWRRGLLTSASWLLTSVAPALVLAFAPFLARGATRRQCLAAAGMIAGALLFNTAVGGDWMPFYRFLVPAAPFVALLLGVLAAHRPRAAALSLALGLAGVQALAQFDVHLAPRTWREALDFRGFGQGYQSEWQRLETSRTNLANFRRIGLGLAQVTEPGDSLTFGAIGAVGWHAPELILLDRNGLVDREVAQLPLGDATRSAGHDRRVPRAFFLPRSPTLFHAVYVPFPAAGPESPQFQAALELAVERVFRQDSGEAPLRAACLPALLPLEPDGEYLPGGSLFVLRTTDDAAAARAYWDARLGSD